MVKYMHIKNAEKLKFNFYSRLKIGGAICAERTAYVKAVVSQYNK